MAATLATMMDADMMIDIDDVDAAVRKASNAEIPLPPQGVDDDDDDTPPPPPPLPEEGTAVQAVAVTVTETGVDDSEHRTIMAVLEKLQAENKSAERLVRRQGTAIGKLTMIMKRRAPVGRTGPPPAKIKCTNCKRVNRRTTLCGPRSGKACKYCADHGINCEGPAVDNRILWKKV